MEKVYRLLGFFSFFRGANTITILGWASGSLEGRIAVEYIDPADQGSKYAFRAHRQNVDGTDCVFPINALAYHPM